MAAVGMAQGERRFGAAYSVRIFVTLGVLGFMLALWASHNDPGTAHPERLWISAILLVALAVLWIAMGKTALIINDFGVRRESVFGQQEIAWSQITETRYRVVPVNLYGHLGLIGAVVALSGKAGSAQLTLELIGPDRKKLKVTSQIRRADQAIGIILGRIMPPMVQNIKARLQRGETVAFGGIGLSATAITWKGNSFPVSEIAKAELVRSNLQIKRQGKWLAAISVRSDKVPDVLVFLEVLESLAPQIRATGIDPLARVRM